MGGRGKQAKAPGAPRHEDEDVSDEEFNIFNDNYMWLNDNYAEVLKHAKDQAEGEKHASKKQYDESVAMWVTFHQNEEINTGIAFRNPNSHGPAAPVIATQRKLRNRVRQTATNDEFKTEPRPQRTKRKPVPTPLAPTSFGKENAGRKSNTGREEDALKASQIEHDDVAEEADENDEDGEPVLRKRRRGTDSTAVAPETDQRISSNTTLSKESDGDTQDAADDEYVAFTESITQVPRMLHHPVSRKDPFWRRDGTIPRDRTFYRPQDMQLNLPKRQKLHCFCRTREDSGMIQCAMEGDGCPYRFGTWFHYDCVDINPKSFPNLKTLDWLCPMCINAYTGPKYGFKEALEMSGYQDHYLRLDDNDEWEAVDCDAVSEHKRRFKLCFDTYWFSRSNYSLYRRREHDKRIAEVTRKYYAVRKAEESARKEAEAQSAKEKSDERMKIAARVRGTQTAPPRLQSRPGTPSSSC